MVGLSAVDLTYVETEEGLKQVTFKEFLFMCGRGVCMCAGRFTNS